MATFGHVTPGTDQSGRIAADTKHACIFFAPEAGTLTSMSAELQNDGNEIVAVKGFASAYTALTAGQTLAESAVGLMQPLMPRTTITFIFANQVAISAGQGIWFGLHFGPTGGNASYWRNSLAVGIGRRLIADDIFADGLESDFGSATADEVVELAMFGTYTPASQVLAGVAGVYCHPGGHG